MSPLVSEPHAASDVELARRIQLAFNQRSSGLKNVMPTVRGGTVILSGTVKSFYHRQLAIECARHIPNVYDVIDEIDVLG